MDRLIYVAMNGAKHLLEQQAAVANNLANINTTGYKAQENAFRALPVVGSPALPTRTFVVDSTIGANMTGGPMQYTGRDLDVAVQGDGFFVVQTPTGEAYTRNGGFTLDANGVLRTQNGLAVQGDSGPITLPDNSTISIGSDGIIYATDRGKGTGGSQVALLKLVNPLAKNLVRGADGLFRTANGQPAAKDETVTVASGMLEGSNVNPMEALVNMISHQRQYETQIQLLTVAEQNSKQSAQIMSLS